MPLWVALCCLIACAIPLRGWRIAATAMLLLENWSLNSWLAGVSGTQFNWAGMAAIDFVTAAIILSMTLTRWQIIVVAIYAYELVAHAARAWAGGSPWSDYYYWYALHYGCWAQLWVVATWLGHDMVGSAWRYIGPAWRARFIAYMPRSVGSDERAGQ